MKQNLIDIIIPMWQEKRIIELHNCPDDNAWIRNIVWEPTEIREYGPRKQGKGICVKCNKKITIVLAGEWIKLWTKWWGWDQ